MLRLPVALFLLLVAVNGSGCSAPAQADPPPSVDLPDRPPMSVRGLSLTLAGVQDGVSYEVRQALSNLADPGRSAAAAAQMADDLLLVAEGSPEFKNALMAATVAGLTADGAVHTFQYSEDAVGDDSGFSMVVEIGFRLHADGTAYLDRVAVAG